MDRIPLLQEILAQNPDDTFARYGLAMALAEAVRTDEALTEYEYLRVHHPEYIPAYQMAGQLLLREGRPEDAVLILTRGVEAAGRAGNRHAVAEMQAMLDDLPAA